MKNYGKLNRNSAKLTKKKMKSLMGGKFFDVEP